MREHPIPQDVTGYKFHIVGNMTLKQFAEVALGVIGAIILYNTNLIIFVKWPLIIASVGFGAMLAFVPIEERPLDHWVITFFKRLYNPTKFYWKKDSKVPFPFTYQKPEDQPELTEVEIDLSPARRNRIKEYLESVQTHQEYIEPWEQEEQSRVSNVLQAFEEVQVANVSAKPQKIKPNLTPRVRNLSSQNAPVILAPKEQVIFEQPIEKPAIEAATGYTETHDYVEAEPEVEVEPEIETEIIENAQPLAQATALEQPLPEPELPALVLEQATIKPQPVVEQTQTQAPQNLSQVESNSTLPFPKAPTKPNQVVGMVLTPDEKLIDRATVTLRNQNNAVVRSVRSNLLGQFFITGTLPNGTFTLETSKQGIEFPSQQLTLSGRVVEPLEIRASA